MRVFLTSAVCKADKNEDQEARLLWLWEQSDHRHDVVSDPASADFILISNIAGEGWFQDMRNHPVINRYPWKSFAISDSDRPMPLLRGIYTSGGKRLWFSSRYRTGAYNLYSQDQRNPKIEGHPGDAYNHPKKYLFSFAGRDSASVRIKLFTLPFNEKAPIINTTSKFSAFGPGLEDQEPWGKNYAEMMEESKYALCPRGVGAASMRLFEAMQMGVAPIILSDDWILPMGPDWEKCALIIPERDADRVYEIAAAHESQYKELGMNAKEAYERYFADHSYFNYLVDQMTDLTESQIIPESWFWLARNLVVGWWKLKQGMFST
jgi:hypothetical protein